MTVLCLDQPTGLVHCQHDQAVLKPLRLRCVNAGINASLREEFLRNAGDWSDHTQHTPP
jgi:hypothetical protein